MTRKRFRRGSRIGKYRLERRLGRGAFGEVWKARDRVESRLVALKIVLPAVIEEWGRKAVEHEARIAGRLDHPNIVSLRNADWVDGHFLLATDLAARSLAEHGGARRSPRVALQVIRDAAAGLAHAHERRVLHLDVKPENIMIFADGRAALADFGTSRLAHNATRTYTEAGTLGYIAPEQAYGRPRQASDVFSLGLIALQLLTGKLPNWPFEWPPGDPRRFEARVPEPVRAVLRKASAFEPERRYSNGKLLLAALDSALRRAERSPRPKPSRPKVRPPAPTPLELSAETFSRHFGRRLGLKFRCHRCDGPIAEAMGYCPWCGSGDNSFRLLTSEKLVCPECERGVRPDWKVCPWCFSGRFDTAGRPYRRDPRAIRPCSRAGCEGRLRRFMKYCPVCKRKPAKPWTHPDLQDRCPRCAGPVSRQFWHHCPWCGRREPRAGAFRRPRRISSG